MRFFLAAIATLAAILAGIAFQREYASNLAVRDDPFALVDRFAAGRPPAPLSWRAMRGAMLACIDMQQGFLLAIQPEPERRAVNANCAAVAEDILARAPTAGFAHLVKAAALAQTGDDVGFERALVVAQATAAQEGWQAARRHVLAAPRHGQLGEAARASFDADVALLLDSRNGPPVLASSYVRHETLRPVLEAAVDAASGDVQRRFLRLVREMMSAQVRAG
jgi:hypothetical protein